jgi:8-oxo-dGTP diphosphatase
MRNKEENPMKMTTLCYIEKDGKYLMLHRTKKQHDINKDKWIGVGGHAEGTEGPEDCLLREVKEETGLDARNAEGGYLFTYKRENPGEGDNYFVDVYRFVMDIDDKDLHLQTEETDGYMFATPDQIREFAEQGIFLHYDSIKQAFEM